MDVEERLPKEILHLASLLGNEYAWKPRDIPPVFRAAQRANLAVVGGQLQFRLPDATCELYWIQFKSSPKHSEETWSEFVQRSVAECSSQFSQLTEKYDFVTEGINAFASLRRIKDSGTDVNEYVCFVVYFDEQLT